MRREILKGVPDDEEKAVEEFLDQNKESALKIKPKVCVSLPHSPGAVFLADIEHRFHLHFYAFHLSFGPTCLGENFGILRDRKATAFDGRGRLPGACHHRGHRIICVSITFKPPKTELLSFFG